MEKIYIGAHLAEIDLKIRGPGEVFGLRQSGFTNLKLADLSDQQTITTAQEEARRILKKDPILKRFPLLSQKIHKFQLELVQPN